MQPLRPPMPQGFADGWLNPLNTFDNLEILKDYILDFATLPAKQALY